MHQQGALLVASHVSHHRYTQQLAGQHGRTVAQRFVVDVDQVRAEAHHGPHRL